VDGEVGGQAGGRADLPLGAAELDPRAGVTLDATGRDGQPGDREGRVHGLDLPWIQRHRANPASCCGRTTTALTG
jgi:hypothetical protein